MKRTAKGLYESVLNALVSRRLYSVAGVLATVATTAKDRRRTRVRWDGEDWEFVWPGGRVFWTSPLLSPRRALGRHLEQYLADFVVAPGAIVLDVGAGIGTEVCGFSQMVGPSGRVIAIEADPVAVRLLRKQAAGLQYRNVDVIDLAVGKDEGSVLLSIAGPGAVQNTVKAVVGDGGITVPSRPLQNILGELGISSVAYMKVNIEGAEYDALLGLGPFIRNIEQMFISCHDFTGVPGQQTYDKVFDHLSSSGLRVTKTAANPDAPWERYYLFADWDSR